MLNQSTIKRQARWREKHKLELFEYYSSYRNNHKDRINETRRIRRAKKRAKLRHRKHSKTWINKVLAQGLCPLCSKPRSERSKRYCEKHLKDARERMRAKRGFKRGTKAVAKLKREPVLASNWNEAQKFIQDNIDLFLDKHDPILDGAIPYEEYRTSMDDFSSQDWMD